MDKREQIKNFNRMLQGNAQAQGVEILFKDINLTGDDVVEIIGIIGENTKNLRNVKITFNNVNFFDDNNKTVLLQCLQDNNITPAFSEASATVLHQQPANQVKPVVSVQSAIQSKEQSASQPDSTSKVAQALSAKAPAEVQNIVINAAPQKEIKPSYVALVPLGISPPVAQPSAQIPRAKLQALQRDKLIMDNKDGPYLYRINPGISLSKQRSLNVRGKISGDAHIKSPKQTQIDATNSPTVSEVEKFEKMMQQQAFKAGTSSEQEQALEQQKRLHIIYGLNQCESVDNAHNAYIHAVLTELKAKKLDVTAFYWQPEWQRFNPKTKVWEKVPLAEAREYFNNLHKISPEAAEDFRQRNEKIDRDKVPYREIRELLKNDQRTLDCIQYFRKQGNPNQPVFLWSIDDDTLSITTNDRDALSQYDELITQSPNVQVLSTGYSGGDYAKQGVNALAVNLDQQVRMATAEHLLTGIYYPEPNMMIRVLADKPTVTESFADTDEHFKFLATNQNPNRIHSENYYANPQESRLLIKDLIDNRRFVMQQGDVPLVYDASRGAIVTTLPKRMQAKNNSAKWDAKNNRFVFLGEKSLTEIFKLAQNHARPALWASSVSRGVPVRLTSNLIKDLQAIESLQLEQQKLAVEYSTYQERYSRLEKEYSPQANLFYKLPEPKSADEKSCYQALKKSVESTEEILKALNGNITKLKGIREARQKDLVDLVAQTDKQYHVDVSQQRKELAKYLEELFKYYHPFHRAQLYQGNFDSNLKGILKDFEKELAKSDNSKEVKDLLHKLEQYVSAENIQAIQLAVRGAGRAVADTLSNAMGLKLIKDQRKAPAIALKKDIVPSSCAEALAGFIRTHHSAIYYKISDGGINIVATDAIVFENLREQLAKLGGQIKYEPSGKGYQIFLPSDEVSLLKQSLEQASKDNLKTADNAMEVDDDIDKAIQQSIQKSYQPLTQQLQIHAQQYSLTCQDVAADGNCLLYALLDQLKERGIVAGANLDHVYLRKLIAKHFEVNFEQYAGFTTQSKEAFLKEIGTNKAWLDHYALVALSRELDVNIVIIHSNTVEPTIIKRPNAEKTIYLGYIDGLHYQSLRGQPSGELTQRVQQCNVIDKERFQSVSYSTAKHMRELSVDVSDLTKEFVKCSQEFPQNYALHSLNEKFTALKNEIMVDLKKDYHILDEEVYLHYKIAIVDLNKELTCTVELLHHQQQSQQPVVQHAVAMEIVPSASAQPTSPQLDKPADEQLSTAPSKR